MTLRDELVTALSDVPGARFEETHAGLVNATWVAGRVRRLISARSEGDLLVLAAGVCLEREAPARNVLIAAARIGGCGVALVGGMYVLQTVIPPSRRNADELRTSVLHLVEAAAALARAVLVAARPGEAALFQRFVD